MPDTDTTLTIVNPISYFLNKTLVRLYEDDLDAQQVSKRDVTNAVVIGSIFAIIVVLVLLLILATLCWCRYYQLLLVNNRLVIRAKGYRFLDDEESALRKPSDKNNQNPVIENEKISSTDFGKQPTVVQDVLSRPEFNASTTAIYEKTAPVTEKSSSADEKYNHQDIPTSGESKPVSAIAIPEESNVNNLDFDSFSKTLFIQKVMAGQPGKEKIESNGIQDLYSDSKLKVGTIVVVVKSISKRELKALLQKYIKDNNQAYSNLSAIMEYNLSDANEETEDKAYLRKGDMLRIFDINSECQLVKGVMLSNYLEINRDSVYLHSRRSFDLDPENDALSLIKVVPFDYITLESSIIKAIDSEED